MFFSNHLFNPILNESDRNHLENIIQNKKTGNNDDHKILKIAVFILIIYCFAFITVGIWYYLKHKRK